MSCVAEVLRGRVRESGLRPRYNGTMQAMSEEEIRRLSDLNYTEALREQTRSCAGEIVEQDGLLLMRGTHPHPILNSAIRLDPARAATDAVDMAEEFFDAADGGFTFLSLCGTDNEDLAAELKRRDYFILASPPAMICDSRIADSQLPGSLTITPARDERSLRDFRLVSAAAWATYEIPPEVPAVLFCSEHMHVSPFLYAAVGYEDETPVAVALAILSHGIAGVYWVGTIPERRGRGFAEALTRHVGNWAFDRGAAFVILQASPMGEPVYRRLGYRTFGQYGLAAKVLG